MPPSRVTTSLHRLLAIAPLSLFLGCDSSTGVIDDNNACRQTYEFGNLGCADIEGRVVDAADRGVSGIIVGPRYEPGNGGFDTSYSTTDADGNFRFRVTRYLPRRPSESGPDTLSLWVSAADPRSAGVGVPATRRDSVRVSIAVVPIGQTPEPVRVTIRLDND